MPDSFGFSILGSDDDENVGALNSPPSPSPIQPLQAPAPLAVQPPKPVRVPPNPADLRDVADPVAGRNAIYQNVLDAAKNLKPLANKRYSLRLENPQWVGPERFTKAQRKAAILEGRTLTRKLRGEWVLSDVASGADVDRRLATIANAPVLNDNGAFVIKGVEYSLGSQQRLRPGAYARRKETGELESHVNVLPGEGPGHRYRLDPEKGVFYLDVRQAKIPAITALRALGARDQELREAWGAEIFARNAQADQPRVLDKLYSKLVSLRDRDADDDADARKRKIREALENSPLDPEVTKRNLGEPLDRAGLKTALLATSKLLKISRGEADVDDRDNLANMIVLGPEDLMAERLAKDYGKARAKLLFQASQKGDLSRLQPGALSDQLASAILSSGLGLALEEINPADVLDKQTRVSRMGEGGIPSDESIPSESRMTQPSHLMFVDGLRTPESSRVGVDLFFSSGMRKGRDGKVYAPFRDKKTGEVSYYSPAEVAEMAIEFPNQDPEAPRTLVVQNGRMRWAERSEVDLEPRDFESAFSPVGNMVPLKSNAKGQRAAMAGRMLTQALPLINAESPWVRSATHDGVDGSYEARYGRKMGAVFADAGGFATAIDKNRIVVRGDDGKEREYELDDNTPFNRKSGVHSTPLVRPGQRVEAGSILAKSNYTDDKGVTALGLNARVAYLPFKGINYEDAVVVSESFAKRATSEHMHQDQLKPEEGYKLGKNAFLGAFGSKYSKKQIENLDDDGVVRPGTLVHEGDPLALAIQERSGDQNRVWKKNASSYVDRSIAWEKSHPGVVTDVAKTKDGAYVVVKSTAELAVGDKMSGRFGDKGVVAAIVPDERMPQDGRGRPFEVLLNEHGVISRGNPAQVVEAVLGAIAEKTGKAIDVRDFDGSVRDRVAWAFDLARKHGVEDLQKVVDPETGRTTPVVLAGNRFVLKLHHLAEGKASGRGVGGYDAEGAPARGPGAGGGSKRLGMLDVNAILSHGALGVLHDARLVRGQKNDEFWLAFLQGQNPPEPEVPHVYRKFVEELRGSGVNVVGEGGRLHVMGMTNKDAATLTGDREIKNNKTVDWDDELKPLAGGLFDPKLTGGHGGRGWSFISNPKPLPSPVMEEPIRILLGLKQQQFEDVIAGKEELNGSSGPGAIGAALEALDVDKELAKAREQIKSGRRTTRDQAVRRLGYLKPLKRLGMKPSEWMLDRVPVVPPVFRPIARMMGGGPLSADANYLYKELLEANDNWRESLDQVEDSGPEQLAAYQAFKAVVGLADPLQPKLREKRVKGLLGHIFGDRAKYGYAQRKLLSTPVDLVGRAVAVPDPDLDMDSIGLPENQAWEAYGDLVTRRLRRRGMSFVEARTAIKDKTADARKELLAEMDERPVYVSRAPVLHRFGVMAFKPKLVPGDVLRANPFINHGFNLDFDGNCVVGDTLIAVDLDLDLLWSSPDGIEWLEKLDGQGVKTTFPIAEFPAVGEPKKDRNGADVYAVPSGVSIASYDPETGQACRLPIISFTVEQSHECSLVTTHGGKTVGVSNNESLAIYDDETGDIVKKAPSESLDCLIPCLKREGEANAADELVPIPRPLRERIALSPPLTRGYVSRSLARHLVADFRDVAKAEQWPLWEQFCRATLNDAAQWERVKSVEPLPAQTVYDFSVPHTKLFMIDNGLIVYDTMSFHVPVGEDARREALERMLPSKNLLSPGDFKTPMNMPTQEYLAGLFAATTKRKAKSNRPEREHYFSDAKAAINAYRRGDLPVNAVVRLLSDKID